MGVPKFGPHDLRRTVATRLGDTDIGTDPIVIEKILNHQLQGVQGVYNMQKSIRSMGKKSYSEGMLDFIILLYFYESKI